MTSVDHLYRKRMRCHVEAVVAREFAVNVAAEEQAAAAAATSVATSFAAATAAVIVAVENAMGDKQNSDRNKRIRLDDSTAGDESSRGQHGLADHPQPAAANSPDDDEWRMSDDSELAFFASQEEEEEEEAPSITTLGPLTADTEIIINILARTEALFSQIQHATHNVTVRDIFILLQADYDEAIIQHYKPNIRQRLLDLVVNVQQPVDNDSQREEEEDEAPSITTTAPPTADTEIIINILARTEALFSQVQHAARDATVRDILILLQADYDEAIIQHYKPNIRQRLLELVVNVQQQVDNDSHGEEEKEEAPSITTTAPPTADTEIIINILARTEVLFSQVQHAAHGVTVRDILVWLQADYDEAVIQHYKPTIRQRLLELVANLQQEVDNDQQGEHELLDNPAAFPLPAPTEVIELLDDSESENEIGRDAAAGKNNVADDDDSVVEEKTLNCIQVVQNKLKEAMASNKVIYLD